MRALLSTLGLAALLASSSAAAQAPAASPETTDERCLLAMVALSNMQDPNAARSGQTGVVFFAGRLKGRNPAFDFSKLTPVAATMNTQIAQTELQSTCGPMLQASLQQLQKALAPANAAPGVKPATPPAPPKH